MKKAPQAQAWRLSGKTFRPHTFTELQLEDSSNGFNNGSVVNPSLFTSQGGGRTPKGIEAMHMMKKGQVKRLEGRDAAGQAKFVESLFGIAA